MSNKQEKHDNENYSKNFTRVPNIVFVSYKHLSKEEKFLYCTLRQVYWDMKPRFVSTRELSDLTGYSRGALGNMLPHLNDCGLVHAEVRREKDREGKEKGNAKYHITIVDIWELNRKYFECSPEERATMDPSLKLVHQMDKNSSPPNGQACPPNEPSLLTKKAKLGTSDGQDRAQVEPTKDNNKDTLKEREKESVPSLPLSQKSVPEEKTVPLEVDYPLFDRLCQEKGYAPDFKVPRNDKNATAIQELRSQGATVEQVKFVFNDIWNDKDPFWQQHRGKPSTVASQFIARVWKMTAPAAKRQTATGTTNWTEDRMGEPAQKAQPVISEQTAKPAQPKYGPKLDPTPAYTRAKFDEPARARSLQARLQAQKEV